MAYWENSLSERECFHVDCIDKKKTIRKVVLSQLQEKLTYEAQSKKVID